MSDIHLLGFQDVWNFICSCFVQFIDFISHVKIGNFSLLGLFITVAVLDLIIGALFVTFNVNTGASSSDWSSSYERSSKLGRGVGGSSAGQRESHTRRNSFSFGWRR